MKNPKTSSWGMARKCVPPIEGFRPGKDTFKTMYQEIGEVHAV